MSDATIHRKPIPRSFFARDPVIVAEQLIGHELIRVFPDGEILVGRIVETEAYKHTDPASHSYSGRSARNDVMFGRPGFAYVYFIYGMYDCFNVVCGPAGVADAVLVRAVEPLFGLSRMWENRYGETMPAITAVGAGNAGATTVKLRNLTSGPGRVCIAFGIRRGEHNGMDVTRAVDLASRQGGISICRGGRTPDGVRATKRIGIRKAADRLWRFVEVGNAFLSRP